MLGVKQFKVDIVALIDAAAGEPKKRGFREAVRLDFSASTPI
jgi:hypothetical protein